MKCVGIDQRLGIARWTLACECTIAATIATRQNSRRTCTQGRLKDRIAGGGMSVTYHKDL